MNTLFNSLTIIAKSLFTPQVPVDASSAESLFSTMPLYSSMYIETDEAKREIKRTPRGYKVRDIAITDSVVYVSENNASSTVSVVSHQEWMFIDNETALQSWFAEVDTISGSGFGCGTIQTYTLQVNDQSIQIHDGTCKWLGEHQFTQVLDPYDYLGFFEEVSNDVYVVEAIQ